MNSILFISHLLAAVIWVGGMFFAYVALRPVAASLLEPPLRLKLWQQVFSRFFLVVWICVLVLMLSGYAIIKFTYGGMAGVGVAVHIMQLTGWIMFLIYAHVFFSPYKKLTKFLAEENYEAAGSQLNKIRQLIAINLSLGLLTVIIAATHRF